MLVGRTAETERLDELLARARGGESGALVLRGEAGIGKTALLEHAANGASGFRVLRAAGVESEAEIAFAGLQQLLGPVTAALDELPPHQARAVTTALGMEEGPAPERLVVASATLSLVAVAAEDQPLAWGVDDAHWLDHASAETLTFVARRLHAEGVVMLFAAREPDRAMFSSAGIPELRVAALAPADARALLADREPDLAELTAEQLVTLTRGNPLALLEVPRALNAEQRAGRSPLEEPLPVGAEVERAYGERARRLSADARRALLLVAACDFDDADALWDVVAPIGSDALSEAERSGLLAPERLAFCHPLARSAVYQLARPAQRRVAHAALAAATNQPDRRAWHLAAAAAGPDERVAAALEDAAAAARRRGGVAAEAKALERAAALTADDESRAGRLLNAAIAAAAAGWFEHAESMLVDVAELTRDSELRAQAVARRSYILGDRGEFGRAYALAVDSAADAAPQDAALILSLGALMSLSHRLEIPTALANAERAWQLVGSTPDADLALAENVARTMILAGHGDEALAIVRSGIERADPATVVAIDFGTDFFYLEDYPRAREALERVVRLTRETTAPGVLSYALDQLAKLETRVANLTRAYALELESVQLTEPLGNEVALIASLVWLALVEAMLGREESRTHAERALRAADRIGDDYNVVRGHGALGHGALARGDVAEAVKWLAPAVNKLHDGGVGHPNFFRLDPDLIEALTRLGRTDEALQHLTRLEGQVHATATVWGRAAAARCRGFLAPAADVREAFDAALALHEHEPSAFERARTELCYGERLRRARERRLARVQLRAALATFEDVGARPWAERARIELEASGEHVSRHDPTAAERLTPQELQIALLVAEGLTNRDVGVRMFLSPKTVEFHLGRVFRKLDVRSRGEVIRLFALEAPEHLPA